MRFEADQSVAAGDRVTNGEREVGEVVNASGHELLAVVPVQMADEPLYINGVSIRRLPLPYLD